MDSYEYNGVQTYSKNTKALAQLAPLGYNPPMGKVTREDIKEMMTPNFDKGKAL